MEWFGWERNLKISPSYPLAMSRKPSTTPDWPETHPTWSWAFPAMGSPQLLWETLSHTPCFSTWKEGGFSIHTSHLFLPHFGDLKSATTWFYQLESVIVLQLPLCLTIHDKLHQPWQLNNKMSSLKMNWKTPTWLLYVVILTYLTVKETQGWLFSPGKLSYYWQPLDCDDLG